MNEKWTFSIKPIKFEKLGYYGIIGRDVISTEYELCKLITQNILYSSYHEPKSFDMISDLLGINTDIVIEAAEYLEEMDFITKISKDEILSNIYISDFSKEILENRHVIFTKYAKLIYESYLPDLCSFIENLFEVYHSQDIKKLANKDVIFAPDSDLNFFRWTITNFALCHKLGIPECLNGISTFYTKRKDGGNNVVFTSIKNQFKLNFNSELFESSREDLINVLINEMTKISIWRYNTFYDDREKDIRMYITDYYKPYYEIIRNFVLNDKNEMRDEIENMLISSMPKNDLVSKLPSIPEHFYKLNQELAKEIFEVSRDSFPKRFHDLCYAICLNSLSSIDIKNRIIEMLLENKVLKPLSEQQKKTVNMILFTQSIN